MTYLAQQIIWCLIAAALIGFVVGWLLASLSSQRRQAGLSAATADEKAALRDESSRLRSELEAASDAGAKLEAELAEARRELAAARDAASEETDVAARLAECRHRLDARESELAGCREARASLEEHLVRVREQVDTRRGQADRDVRDDLTRIEGIGPKIAQLLADAGITSWARLAQTEVDRLRQILADAGPRFDLHRPETWPHQAKLAAEGRFRELDELQDHLDGGAEPD